MKKRVLIAAAIAVVLMLCAGLYTMLTDLSGGIARVYHYGELIDTIDLDKVAQPYEIEIQDKDGHVTNVIEVEQGRLRVREAVCPDQVCVERGWSEGSRLPIACLPNELIITMEWDN